MRKDKNKKSNSGLGEFWDNWIEEDRQCRERIQKLIDQKKQEAHRRNSEHKE